MSTRLGLFGGSFNPIHLGHLICARAVAERLRLDRIVLIPAAAPPHKPTHALAPAQHRLAMARLAVQGDALFEVSDIELSRPGPSYTFDTVSSLRTARPDVTEWNWIIGADSLAELESWHRIADLAKLTRIVTMVRPGHTRRTAADLPGLLAKLGPPALEEILALQLPTPAIDISATDIRTRVARRQSIRYLTPDAVVDYIREQAVYTS